MRFNNFFMEYKLGLKGIKKTIPLKELPFFRKAFLISLIATSCVSLILFLFLGQGNWTVLYVILAILFVLHWGVFTWMDSRRENRKDMLKNHFIPYSKERMSMLITLLKNYGIKSDQTDYLDKIDLLIQQAEENKIKDNPFLAIGKSLKLFCTVVIPAIVFVATKVAEQLSIQNLIVIVIGYVILLGSFFAMIFALHPFIMKFGYPDYEMYEELIYDLKQLKIFYCNSDE